MEGGRGGSDVRSVVPLCFTLSLWLSTSDDVVSVTGVACGTVQQ